MCLRPGIENAIGSLAYRISSNDARDVIFSDLRFATELCKSC